MRPWNEWLIGWGYDINQRPPDLDDAAATKIVRGLLGMPDLEPEITGYSLWGRQRDLCDPPAARAGLRRR